MTLDDDDKDDDDVILLFRHLALDVCVFIVKVKVKVTLEQATKDQRGSRGIALLFL
jgi:hypothetical protein